MRALENSCQEPIPNCLYDSFLVGFVTRSEKEFENRKQVFVADRNSLQHVPTFQFPFVSGEKRLIVGHLGWKMPLQTTNSPFLCGNVFSYYRTFPPECLEETGKGSCFKRNEKFFLFQPPYLTMRPISIDSFKYLGETRFQNATNHVGLNNIK